MTLVNWFDILVDMSNISWINEIDKSTHKKKWIVFFSCLVIGIVLVCVTLLLQLEQRPGEQKQVQIVDMHAVMLRDIQAQFSSAVAPTQKQVADINAQLTKATTTITSNQEQMILEQLQNK